MEAKEGKINQDPPGFLFEIPPILLDFPVHLPLTTLNCIKKEGRLDQLSVLLFPILHLQKRKEVQFIKRYVV